MAATFNFHPIRAFRASSTGVKVSAGIAGLTLASSAVLGVAVEGAGHGTPHPTGDLKSSAPVSTTHSATPSSKSPTSKVTPSKTTPAETTPTKTTPPPPPPITNTYTQLPVKPVVQQLDPGVYVVNYPGYATVTAIDLGVAGNRVEVTGFGERKQTAAGMADDVPGTDAMQNGSMFDLPGDSPWPTQDPSGNGWQVIEGAPVSNGVPWPAQFTTDSGDRPALVVGSDGARIVPGGKAAATDSQLLQGHNLVVSDGKVLGPFAPAQDGAVINLETQRNGYGVSQNGEWVYGVSTAERMGGLDAAQVLIDGVHEIPGAPTVATEMTGDSGGSTQHWDKLNGNTAGTSRLLGNGVRFLHNGDPRTTEYSSK